LEFMVGVANNFGGFYHTEFYLHEAKRAGAVIEAPCVNMSEELCSLRVASGRPTHNSPLTTPRIYLGLGNIKGFPAEAIDLILNERQRYGPFEDLPDLLRRVPLHVEQARVLVRVGALRFTKRSKVKLLWDLALMHRGSESASSIGDLFIAKVEEPRLPELEHHPLADAYDELELLGFPLCDPFSLVTIPDDQGSISARDMPAYKNKRVSLIGYMIH